MLLAGLAQFASTLGEKLLRNRADVVGLKSTAPTKELHTSVVALSCPPLDVVSSIHTGLESERELGKINEPLDSGVGGVICQRLGNHLDTRETLKSFLDFFHAFVQLERSEVAVESHDISARGGHAHS